MRSPSFLPIINGAMTNPIVTDKKNLMQKYISHPTQDIHTNIVGWILFSALHPKNTHTPATSKTRREWSVLMKTTIKPQIKIALIAVTRILLPDPFQKFVFPC